MTSPITDLLLADGPASDDLELFGRLVGAWTFEGRLTAPDGTETQHRGRWDFGYVLGGRAIQDVLHCEGVDHGTTLRVPLGDGTWEIVYVSAIHPGARHLRARPDGDRIVLTGSRGGTALRWTFDEIAADSFVWRGEESTDGGATFHFNEEMRLRRA